jgi:uncharacterized membrane protein (UPF0182 family)
MSRSLPGPFEPRLIERFREIRVRPSSRVWVGIGFIAAALLVVLVTSPLVGFIAENEWYNALGIGSVYRTRISYEAWLFCLTFVISFGFAAANVLTALRLRSGSTLIAVGIRRRVLRTPAGAAGLAAAALIALVVAAGARTRWTDLALFLHYTPYTSTGVKEPLYNLDVSFYLLTLPFLHDLVGWGTGLVLTVGLLIAAVYAWYRQTLDLHFSRGAIGHLSVLLGLLGLALAAGAFLGRYDLLYSHNGVVWGAGYTDVNVRSGLAAVQAVLLLLLAGLLLANARLRRGRVVVVAVGAWFVVSLMAGIYPNFVQRVSVQPAELSQESPYIKHEIDYTRRAYGLRDVNVRPYGGNAQVTAQDVGGDQATIENLRLWDDRQIQETYQQLQSIRTYYSFKQIDLDRYVIGGRLQQVEISAREVDQSKLPVQAQTWVNQKLVYTHGYGAAASPVSAVVGEGLPDYVVGNIPPQGPLQVTEPDIYFGQLTTDYALAPSAQREFDYPKGSDNAFTSYRGTHGVSLAGLNRLLWSARTDDFNLLVSDQVHESTQILFRRDVQSRISAIAPFLQLDDSPYVVVVDGHIYWIQDAYITAGTYPYSHQEQVAGDGVNYLRNSVKAVVDAYQGTIDFYITDPTDPIIRAYASTFPGLFKPLDQMPARLRAHLRVPPHQFSVQSAVFATYHISDQDPSVLYNREDVWDLAVDQPYYVEIRLPGAAQAEYLQIVPYSPFKKQNLVSWLAVRNDPAHYGEMTAFVLPKDKVVLGPQQVTSRIQQTPGFSSTRTLLNQQGSSLIEGTLLVVPIGDSFLYFEPIYLKSTVSTQALPELKFVILTDATGLSPVVFQPTLQQALGQLTGEAPAPTGAPGTQPSGATNPQVGRLLDDALKEYQAALDALKTDDLVSYQQHLQRMVADLQQADQLTHGSAPATAPSPSPRG